MPLTWTIEVRDATTGAVKGTLTPDDHVVRIDSFEVFTGGDCGEANLTALATVNINPRDIITISTRAHDASFLTPRYRGVCVLAGSPEGAEPQRFRFTGLRSRYYELTTLLPVIASADAATMANQVLREPFLAPTGVLGTSRWPLTGFVLGDRYPALESAGQTLDALAEAVGAFIVPAGETYTYDGHTYVAGDVVPSVRWGVNATGAHHFRRPAHVAPLAVSEASEDVVVRWRGVSAERVVDRVRLVYAANYAEVSDASMRLYVERPFPSTAYSLAPFAVPLARLFTASAEEYRSEVVIPLEAPGDYLQRITPLGVRAGTATDTANAFDGSASTYAEAIGGARNVYFSYQFAGSPACVLYLDVQLSSASFVAASGREVAAEVSLGVRSGASNTPRQLLRYDIEPVEAAERRRLALPVLPSADAATPAYSPWETYNFVEFLITLAEGGRFYQVEPQVPDVDLGGTASGKLASGYFVSPPPAVASIERLGIHAHADRVTLTPASGNPPIDLHIERTEWSISTERGATTTYYAGQPFEGDLMAQRAVLEALAARAARKSERERIT